MKFEKAIQKLKEGEKIRRPMWGNGCFLILESNNEIRNNQGVRVDFCNINSFLAIDWEVYEEEPTRLGNKIFYAVSPEGKPGFGRHCVGVNDLKETIEILRDDLKQAVLHDGLNKEWKVNAIIEKRFGRELI